MLYPSSTADGVNFRYATNIDKTGVALDALDTELKKFEPVESVYAKYFYLEQVFYITTTNKEDIILNLSSVEILPGTNNSNLYKSIRIALLSDDDTILIRHDDGVALPANGDDTTVEVDPAITCSALESDDFEVLIPGMTYNSETLNNYCTPVKVTLRLWIEGQSSFAVAEYSGHAFMANLEFDARLA